MNTPQISAMIRYWDNINMELLLKILELKNL